MSVTSKNRFGSIIDANRARQAEPPLEPEAEVPSPVAAPDTASVTVANKRGGKSSNPEYRHITAYIRRTTHRAAHRKLLDEGTERDLSEVIEELLSNWVQASS